MVSLKDVARHAGVSDKTVSRALNDAKSVKRRTREKIESAIEELGYVPNQGARLLRGQRSCVIGVMTDIVMTSPKSVEILRGIQDRIRQSQNSVLIANTSNDPENERTAWKTFRQHKIDGLIYVTMYHHEVSFDFDEPPHPMVLANCTCSKIPELPSVVPDDFEGGYNAARYALDQGHERIAFLTLNPQIPAAKLRSKGFEKALREAKLNPKAMVVDSGFRGAVGEEQLCAYDKARLILEQPAATRPTAILCGNDEVALQVTCAALSLGMKIPKDVAVIGFDDLRIISTGVEPQLTTVALPYYAIGVRAAERLLGMLDGSPDMDGLEKVDCPMVRRDSA